MSWMIENAKNKKRLLRLKGVDPSIFGRGAEEIEGLKRENIPFQIFSGINSSQEANNNIKHNLHKKKSIYYVTGRKAIRSSTPITNYRRLAKFNGQIVIYIGLSQINAIAKKLISYGKNKNTDVRTVSYTHLRAHETR